MTQARDLRTFIRILVDESPDGLSEGQLGPSESLFCPGFALAFLTRTRTHKSLAMSASLRYRPPLCNRSKCRDGSLSN
jgi:hypothetical protein